MRLETIGIPKRTVTALEKRKIYTEEDLVRFLPRKYRDYRRGRLIWECKTGEFAAVRGVLRQCEKRQSGNRTYVLMKLEHEEYLINVLCFGNVYQYNRWRSYLYSDCVICGQVSYDEKYGTNGYSITNPDIVAMTCEFEPTILTVYPSVKGVSDYNLRSMIRNVVSNMPDLLPGPVLSELDKEEPMMGYQEALEALHYPESLSAIRDAKRRLDFNDLLYFAYEFRHAHDEDTEYTFAGCPDDSLMRKLIGSLPFKLTSDQEKAVNKLAEKAYYGRRINCLVQGDVGSGKTIIAACLMMLVSGNGNENGKFQCVLMAPREVLARQHYNEISGYAEMLGLKCAYLHSGLKSAEKKKLISSIQDGEVSFIIGTTSVLSETVSYKNLALMITDEEHLFGVDQKEKLAEQARNGIHVISMTATPIPRSLASVIYGDSKELIEIKSKPEGRLEIKTAKQLGHSNTFPFMEKEIWAGHQCYVICPAIDENSETEIFSVEEAERLYKEYFEPKGIRVGVLNGRMSAKDISDTIDAFSKNEYQILISTTVIEVGVNIPNATVIVIEQAERFGLAQLHQLRGRVGRSVFQSYCLLISQDKDNPRLNTMVETTDGFKIAEADLEQRGSGSLIGSKQAGFDKYVDLMLQNRDLYNIAVSLVKKFGRTGYLNRLALVYNEHIKMTEG